MRLFCMEVKWKLELSGGDKSKEWVLCVEVFRCVLKWMLNVRVYVFYFLKVGFF